MALIMNLEVGSDGQTDGEEASALTGRVYRGRNCLVVVLIYFVKHLQNERERLVLIVAGWNNSAVRLVEVAAVAGCSGWCFCPCYACSLPLP